MFGLRLRNTPLSFKGRMAAAWAATVLSLVVTTGQHQVHAAEAYKPISQPFNVEGVMSSVPVLNLDGSTYVALRLLNDKIGLATGWDPATKTVTVDGNNRKLVLNLKTGVSTMNEAPLGVPTITYQNSTYLPLRLLLERMGYSVDYDPKTRLISIAKIHENPLKIGTDRIRESDDKLGYTLEMYYPVVSGFDNAAVQDKINAFLKKEALARFDAAKPEMVQTAKNNYDYMKENPDVTISPTQYQGTYTITYNEKNRLSLYYDLYFYTGGAHGVTLRESFTFDLNTGEQLTLPQAAENNPNYVNLINAEINEQFDKRELPQLNPFKTIEPDRPYYIKHEGLVIYFQQYEYTPYAAGIPEFVIPFETFR